MNKFLTRLIHSVIYRKGAEGFLQLYYFKRQSTSDLFSEWSTERVFLEQLIDKMEIKAGQFVDIGASDGFSFSSTYGFAKSGKFSGLSVEMNWQKFLKMSVVYSEFPLVSVARVKVTPKNIVELLQGFHIKEDFDVLNLDIDSYDLHVLESMLRVFRPKIISMEFNEKIPLGIFFTVDYFDEHFWRGDHFFGCSLEAACQLLFVKGYFLHRLIESNAVFVSEELLSEQVNSIPYDQAYLDSYVNSKERASLYPFNSNVNYWLDLELDEAINEIQNFFRDYNGLYTLRKA